MKKLLASGGFLLLLIFSLGSVHAADIPVTLPGITSAETTNPGGWVSALYQFSLMAAGMLAFGMIVYAGLRYTFAAGNPSTQSDARDQILQALLGLLLLFGAFIVLTTINPNLTNLTLPGLGKIEGQEGTYLPGGGSDITDKYARDYLKDNGGITVNSPEPKTSLKGIRQFTLGEAVSVKKNSGCATEVTAGTEKDNHITKDPKSHVNGYKIDINRSGCLDNHITTKFRSYGTREDDGAPLYLAP